MPTFQQLVGRPLVIKARLVKDVGNAAGRGKPASQGQATGALKESFHIIFRLARAREQRPLADAAMAQVPTTTLTQLH